MTEPRSADQQISWTDLRALVNYDHQTGIFTWAKAIGGNTKVGKELGLEYKGRWRMGIRGIFYIRSRLAWFYMTGKWPVDQIDHKDRNSLNDRFENLREATKWQNLSNRSKYRGKSKYRGVIPYRNGWRANIGHKGPLRYLGDFKTEENAALAYNFWAAELHGEFAVLNMVS